MPRRVPALVSDPVLKFLALASGRRVALTDTGLKHGVALTGGHGATAGARASGPPVVLALHGAPGSHRDFRYLGAYLEPHARVLRLDLPGHGGTPLVHGTTRAGLSARETAAFVAEVLDALQIHSPVHVVGHSLAGMVVGHFAAHHAHRVASVSLVCSIGFRPHKGIRPYPVVRAVARAMDHPRAGSLLLDLVHKVYTGPLGFPKRTTLEEVRVCQGRVRELDFEGFRRNVEAIPRSIPAVLAYARDDWLVEPAIGEELAAALPAGPRLVHDEGGHALQKTRAEDIAAAIVGVMARVERDRASR